MINETQIDTVHAINRNCKFNHLIKSVNQLKWLKQLTEWIIKNVKSSVPFRLILDYSIH